MNIDEVYKKMPENNTKQNTTSKDRIVKKAECGELEKLKVRQL